MAHLVRLYKVVFCSRRIQPLNTITLIQCLPLPRCSILIKIAAGHHTAKNVHPGVLILTHKKEWSFCSCSSRCDRVFHTCFPSTFLMCTVCKASNCCCVDLVTPRSPYLLQICSPYSPGLLQTVSRVRWTSIHPYFVIF